MAYAQSLWLQTEIVQTLSTFTKLQDTCPTSNQETISIVKRDDILN